MKNLITKSSNPDSFTFSRTPTSSKELSNESQNDNQLDKNILRFNQTLQNYLKVSVGNHAYNLTKYDEKQPIDTTVTKTGNAGGHLLLLWKI